MRIPQIAAAVAAAALLLSGCTATGDAADSGDAPTIAFLLPETITARYEAADRPAFENAVAELCPECKVIYSNADGDAAAQQSQIEAAVTQGADVIVINAVDPAAIGTAVSQAKAQGVKVIAHNRLVANAELDAFIAADTFAAGAAQGQTMVDGLAETGVTEPRVVMINGDAAEPNMPPIRDGALSVFEEVGTVVTTHDTPGWDPAKAQEEMDQTITALGPDGFDAVYAMNDGLASGVIASLKSAGIDPGTKFVSGLDGDAAALQRILAGEQYMTVAQPVIEYAEAAAAMAVALARGEELPAGSTTSTVDNGSGVDVPTATFSLTVVTKDSVKDIVAIGLTPYADVCTEAYLALCEEYGVTK